VAGLAAEPLPTARLDLEPVRVNHAAEVARAFADAGLHTFTGGEPATEEEWRARLVRRVVGHSPDGSETWLNWMVRRRDTGELVGVMQATVRNPAAGDADGDEVAEIGWTVATAHQHRGYAREAATAMVEEVRRHGVRRFIAHIHPGHHASMGVARALGLAPTGIVVDREIRWSTDDQPTT
jgi:RimJ/RimL family protein N-acetyltransferase